MLEKFAKWFSERRLVIIIVDWLKSTSLPGFQKRSLYDVGKFFFQALFDEDLTLRASSISFSFFLALFPAIIFLFTLIPYIPIEHLQDYLMNQIQQLIPASVFDSLVNTIEEIVRKQNGGLLSFGFIAAIYFISNGFATMMTAFNKYVNAPEKRSWISERIVAIGIVFLIASILILTLAALAYFNLSLTWLSSKDWFTQRLYDFLLTFIQYGSLFFLIYFVFSSLYFFGSSRVSKWRFFSPGSTLATILSVIATAGFSSYVNHFNSYNKLYGSIGTILVLMLLIYFNCIVLLVGFELNSSIDRAGEYGKLSLEKDNGNQKAE